jgi:hypothetical protein
VTSTAADYTWFEERPAGLSESCCLTLVRGLAPGEFLGRLDAQPDRDRIGVETLFEPSMKLWDSYPDSGLLIGVATVRGDGGGWSLGVEFNGYLGVTEEVIVRLSAGTRAVSYYRHNEAVDRFCWAEDRQIRLAFSPFDPLDRNGSTPDALLDTMRAVGFDLSEEGEDEHYPEATLALAERLTGVRITPELLEEASFACGIVPVPPS